MAGCLRLSAQGTSLPQWGLGQLCAGQSRASVPWGTCSQAGDSTHRVDVQEQGVLLAVGAQAKHRFCQDWVSVVEVRVGEKQGGTWKAEVRSQV
jgi:hypothetical protein